MQIFFVVRLINFVINFVLGCYLGHLVSLKENIPKFSNIISVRTLDGVKYYNFLYKDIILDKYEKKVCYGKCFDYNKSSWGSSSWGGGK